MSQHKEHRLIYRRGSPEGRETSGETPEQQYERITSGVDAILSKYATNRPSPITGKVYPNPVRDRQLKTFHDIYDPLKADFENGNGDKGELVSKMELIADELFDALTRSPAHRKLTRRNRLDTDSEHKVVLRETEKTRLRKRNYEYKMKKEKQEAEMKELIGWSKLNVASKGATMYLSENGFSDRFKASETTMKKIIKDIGSRPHLSVKVENNIITGITYSSIRAEKPNTPMKEVEAENIGLVPSKEVMEAIGDEMHAALMLHYGSNIERTSLENIRVAPLANSGEEQKWLLAAQKQAREYTRVHEGIPEHALPYDVLKVIPPSGAILKDGTKMKIRHERPTGSRYGYTVHIDIEPIDSPKEEWVLSRSLTQFSFHVPDEICRLTCVSHPEKNMTTGLQGKHFLNPQGPGATAWQRFQSLFGTELPKRKPATLNPEKLMEQIQRAKNERESEIQDEANIGTFDLPKDEPIGVITLIGKDDPATGEMIDSARFFPKLLAREGYDMCCIEGADAIDPNELIAGFGLPPAILRRKIKQYRKLGVKSIFIELYAHGDKKGFHFMGKEVGNGMGGKGRVNESLAPDELSAILSENSDMKIFVKSVACHGGNAANAIPKIRPTRNAKSKDQYVFLQATPETPNMGLGKYQMPVYDAVLIDSISNGKPYGKGHVKGDWAAKREYSFNAEVLRVTPYSILKTSDTIDPDAAAPLS